MSCNVFPFYTSRQIGRRAVDLYPDGTGGCEVYTWTNEHRDSGWVEYFANPYEVLAKLGELERLAAADGRA